MARDAKYGVVLSEFPLPGSPSALGHDEPVFLIRGRDFTAPQAILAYAEIAESEGASEEFVTSCRQRADEIVRWQQSSPALVKRAPD